MEHHINEKLSDQLKNYSLAPTCYPCRLYEMTFEHHKVLKLLKGEIKMAYDERQQSYFCLAVERLQDVDWIAYSFRVDSGLFIAQLESDPTLCTFQQKAYSTKEGVVYVARFNDVETATSFAEDISNVMKEEKKDLFGATSEGGEEEDENEAEDEEQADEEDREEPTTEDDEESTTDGDEGPTTDDDEESTTDGDEGPTTDDDDSSVGEGNSDQTKEEDESGEESTEMEDSSGDMGDMDDSDAGEESETSGQSEK